MERMKTMEKFKKEIQHRVALFVGVVLICIILGFVSMSNPDLIEGQVAGFQLGIVFGLGILASVQIVKLRMVLNDDKKLQQLYNQEHDERMQLIRGKAGMPMLLVTSVVLLLAAIIAGYSNVIVFYTLVAAVGFQLTLGACVKVYYMRTM